MLVDEAVFVAPRLLVVAHGTASAEGSATTSRLVTALAAARPQTVVDVCFLDVAAPRLPDALDDRPTIVVPLVLSTGYHVQTDIPQAVAGHPQTRVAAHLGPDPLLADALAVRLGAAPSTSTVLAAVGSSRPDANAELATMADLLSTRLGRRVTPATAAELPAVIAALPAPIRVLAYLLAEGQFLATLRAAVADRGTVSAPIGVHPALVELVWRRYDEAGGRAG